MNEIEVVRLNIERFRRMLETELDATVRQTIQKMLDEFQDELCRRLGDEVDQAAW